MKSIFSLFAALMLCAGAFAQQLDNPVNVPITYYGMGIATAPSCSFSFGSELGAATSATYTNGSGQNFYSPATTSYIVPGKTYNVTVTSSGCGNVIAYFPRVAGYEVYINGQRMGAFSMGTNYSFQLRVEAINDLTGSLAGKRGGQCSSFPEDKAIWYIGLGSLRNGRFAGGVGFRASAITSALFNTSSLLYDTVDSSEVSVTRDSNGYITQIQSRDVVLQMDPYNASGTSYSIRAYQSSNLATPFITYTISQYTDASGSGIQIDKLEDGVKWSTVLVKTGTGWIKYDWRVNHGTFSTANPIVTTVSGSTNSVNYGQVDSQNTSNALTKVKTYTTVNGHTELASETWGPSLSVPQTTTYAYYSSASGTGWPGEVQSKIDPTGKWVAYDYYNASGDTRAGLIQHVYRPWLDAPATPSQATQTNCYLETYDYTTNYDGSRSAPVSRVVSINGTTISQSSWSYNWSYTTANAHTVGQTVQNDYSSSGSYLTTTTLAYRPDDAMSFFRGKLHSVTRPDGTKDACAYYSGSWSASTSTFTPGSGNDYLVLTFHGQAASGSGTNLVSSWTVGSTVWNLDALYLVPNLSQVSELVIDTNGRKVFEAENIYTGSSIERISGTSYTFNGNNLVTNAKDIIRSVSASGGDVSVSYGYSAGLLTSRTDVDGSSTQWGYDDYLRNTSVTTAYGASVSGYPATTQSYTYYSSGLKQTGQESARATTVTSYRYNTAGQVIAESVPNPSGGSALTTSYAYNSKVQTVATLPTLATRQSDLYLDGKLKDQTGTARVASYFDYSIDAGTGNIVKTTRHDANKANGWLEETSDWLARVVKSRAPEYQWTSSNSNVLRKDYSFGATTGQLVSVSTTDEATSVKALPNHYYIYGNLGLVTQEGDDVGGNGQLDAASTDRITLYNHYFYKDSQSGGANGWIRVDQTQVYRTLNNASDITTVSQVNTRYTGFNWGNMLGTARVLSDVTTIDASGRFVNDWIYADAGAHTKTKSRSVQGVSNYALTIWQDGYLASEQSTSGVKKTYAYDSAGRLSSTTEATTNATVTNTYFANTDFLNTVTSTIGASTNTVSTYGYSWNTSANSSVVSVTDSAGNVAYTESNALGLTWRTWGTAAQPTLITYDAYGRRTNITTWQTGGSSWTGSSWPASLPTGANTVTWNLDPASGLATYKQFADATQVQFTYNARGQMKTRRWARSLNPTTTYNYYDSTGSLTGELQSVSYSDSTPGVSYTYTRTGNIATVADAAGTRTIAYGTDLKPTSETYDASFYGSKVLTLNYDSIGRSTGYSFNGSSTVGETYGYDATTGRISSYTGVYGASTFPFTIGFASGTDWANSVTSGSYSRSLPLVSRRDVISNVTTSWGTTELGSFTADYSDPRGWRNGQTAAADAWTAALIGANTLSQTYGFDGYGQLTSSTGKISGVQSPAHTYGWTYDLAGNRLTETGAASTSYTPNSVNEYSSITGSPLGEGNPGYDADGNLTQDATWTYSYDCENRLTTMTKSGQALTFKYDYLGRRIEKIVTGTGASDTKYLWAGWTLVAELSSNGATVNRGFVYGPDFSDAQGNAGGAGSLLAQVDGGVATYTVPDVLGNVAGYVSNAGTLIAAVEYSPYGRVISTSGNYTSYPIGYAGQYTDWETGLVCYGHRYYWAKHGRFINRDPIEEQGGYNLYAFCLNGPTFRWDVLGNIVIPIGFSNSASGRYSTVLMDTSTGRSSMEFNSAQGDTGSYYKFIDAFDNTPHWTPSVPTGSKAGSGKSDNKDDFLNFQVPAAAGKGSNSGALIDFNSLGAGFGDSDSVSTPLAGGFTNLASTDEPSSSLKLVGSFGISGALGVMWGVSPGIFFSGGVNAQVGIDLQHPLSSYVGINYTYSPMVGVGVVATVSAAYGGGLDWGEVVHTGVSPTATTLHGEVGVQDGPMPYVTNAAFDFNTSGATYARPGEGVGVDLHAAVGVSQTKAVNVTLGDLVNYINITYLAGQLPMVGVDGSGHHP